MSTPLPAPSAHYCDSAVGRELAVEQVQAKLAGFRGVHPQGLAVAYPRAAVTSLRRDPYSSTRVCTRQARGMDTPKANMLRHEEVVTAARGSSRSLLQQHADRRPPSPGMDTSKANKLRHEEVVTARG